MKSILLNTLDMLSECEESIYATNSLQALRNVISNAINEINSCREPDMDQLALMFAPTGDLQEISIDNDRAAVYLTLAARFDTIVSGIRNRR